MLGNVSDGLWQNCATEKIQATHWGFEKEKEKHGFMFTFCVVRESVLTK